MRKFVVELLCLAVGLVFAAAASELVSENIATGWFIGAMLGWYAHSLARWVNKPDSAGEG